GGARGLRNQGTRESLVYWRSLETPGQEEYPARLLPTLPPYYEDNLQNRLRRAQKGIFLASLKMILNSEYQLPVLRSVSQVTVQPSVIGGTSGRKIQHGVRVR
ncbi:unnamed protein product, partial [Ascophyllum nodosum]